MTRGRFAGKTVMITGAAGGLGAAAARRFAAEGAGLVLSDLDKSGLEDLASDLHKPNINLFFEVVDITKEDEIAPHLERAVNAVGAIDIAVNNAGIGQSLRPVWETSVEEFEKVMAVNVRSVFLCMKHQLSMMVTRGSGTILNVSSAAGLVGAGQMAAYAASKHAVIGLTRSASDEVARFGIRINALCPSFAPTPLFNAMADDIGSRHGLDRSAASKHIASRIPMRRLAEIDEVVQAMLWLCDPANSFMTGQAVAIDGGLTAV